MNIVVDESEGAKLVIKIDGSIDTVTAPDLEAFLADRYDGITALVIDMAAVDYVSSAGLRVILSADKEMSSRGSLVLKNVNPEVREVFEMTGFDELLTIE